MVRLGEEDLIHIQIVNWLLGTTIPFYHYANERKTTPQYGALLKRKGVKRGVLDLHFPRPNQTFKDMWIELKSSTGRLTKEQKAFMIERQSEGSCCQVARSKNEAILMIKAFYGISESVV